MSLTSYVTVGDRRGRYLSFDFLFFNFSNTLQACALCGGAEGCVSDFLIKFDLSFCFYGVPYLFTATPKGSGADSLL